MSDKEIKLIKEIIQSPHELKHRYTSAQIVEWLSHQQQLIDSQAKQLKLAVKVLEEEMESAKIWGQHGTVKHIKDTLLEIRSLSGGTET